MNNLMLPCASFWIASLGPAPPHIPEGGLIGVFAEQGMPGLILLGVGWVSIWMEKQRRKTGEADRAERLAASIEDRKERKEYFNELVKVIDKKDKILDEQRDWIRSFSVGGK